MDPASSPAHQATPGAAGPILVVDDDAKIVSLVRAYLERAGFSVVAARDGVEALRAVEIHRPRLVVLDLMLPELDGLAVMRALAQLSRPPILMLSARGSTADRVTGIAEGADDYLPKPFSPAELVIRVEAILRRSGGSGRRPGDRGALRLRDLRIDLDRHEVVRDDTQIPLTDVEFRLLATLAEADGRVLTRELLIERLYAGGGGEIFERTIDVHVRRLREKLSDDAENPRYISTVRGAGYRAVARG